jgi:hypothetical protein
MRAGPARFVIAGGDCDDTGEILRASDDAAISAQAR